MDAGSIESRSFSDLPEIKEPVESSEGRIKRIAGAFLTEMTGSKLAMDMLEASGCRMPRCYLPSKEKVDDIFRSLYHITQQYKDKAGGRKKAGDFVLEETFDLLQSVKYWNLKASIWVNKIKDLYRPSKVGEFWRNLLEKEGLDGLAGMLGVWKLRARIDKNIRSDAQNMSLVLKGLVDIVYTRYQENQIAIKNAYRGSDKDFYKRTSHRGNWNRALEKTGLTDRGIFVGVDKKGKERCLPRKEDPKIRFLVGDSYMDVSREEIKKYSFEFSQILYGKELRSFFQSKLKPLSELDEKDPPLIVIGLRKSGLITSDERAKGDYRPFYGNGQLATFIINEEYDLTDKVSKIANLEAYYNHVGTDGSLGVEEIEAILERFDSLAEENHWAQRESKKHPEKYIEVSKYDPEKPFPRGLEIYQAAMKLSGLTGLEIGWHLEEETELDLLKRGRRAINERIKVEHFQKIISRADDDLTCRLRGLEEELELMEDKVWTRRKRGKMKQEHQRLVQLKEEYDGNKKAVDECIAKQLNPRVPSIFLPSLGLGIAARTPQHVCVLPDEEFSSARLCLAGVNSPEMSGAVLEEFQAIIKNLGTVVGTEDISNMDLQAFLSNLKEKGITVEKLEQDLQLWSRYFFQDLINARSAQSISMFMAYLSGPLEGLLTVIGQRLNPRLVTEAVGSKGQASILRTKDPRIEQFTTAVSERHLSSLSSLNDKKLEMRFPINNRFVRRAILQLVPVGEAEQKLKQAMAELKDSASEAEINKVLKRYQKIFPSLKSKVQNKIIKIAGLEVNKVQRATILMSFLTTLSLGRLSANEKESLYFDFINEYRVDLISPVIRRYVQAEKSRRAEKDRAKINK